MRAIVLVPFFTQEITGVVGSEVDIQDQKTFDDLVKAGYIRAVDEADTPKKKK